MFGANSFCMFLGFLILSRKIQLGFSLVQGWWTMRLSSVNVYTTFTTFESVLQYDQLEESCLLLSFLCILSYTTYDAFIYAVCLLLKSEFSAANPLQVFSTAAQLYVPLMKILGRKASLLFHAPPLPSAFDSQHSRGKPPGSFSSVFHLFLRIGWMISLD